MVDGLMLWWRYDGHGLGEVDDVFLLTSLMAK